jgi:UDP-3-O-[3-hydroxymyristoyl] glucosamine N-acyltransferase
VIGDGNIICAGNILTTSINIGSFNYINLSCTIGHDSFIGDYNVINPTVNISGGVKMGNEILLGTGTQILQNKNICSNCVVGAGAVVTKNLEEKGVYVGAPAKNIK